MVSELFETGKHITKKVCLYVLQAVLQLLEYQKEDYVFQKDGAPDTISRLV